MRDAMLQFIADFDPRLRRISRQYVADPRPVGGSMFRIYGDICFSRDKSLYKTNVGASFNHATAKNMPAHGYYSESRRQAHKIFPRVHRLPSPHGSARNEGFDDSNPLSGSRSAILDGSPELHSWVRPAGVEGWR